MLVILVVVIAIVACCVSRLTKNVNTQLSGSYLVSTVTRQDQTVRVSGTATLQPADSYNDTTLLSGDIVSAPFEEGDLVTKDTLLYTMDSSDAQDSVDRAQISVEQAQMTYQQAQEALHPTAPISGTVSEVYVHNGESVNAGSQLARIVARTELSIDFLFPYASPSDFYVGQTATVFIDGYAGTQTGTVTNVSNSTTITSTGMQAIPVRVRLHRVGQADAELAPVAEQALETRRVLRRGDDENIAYSGQHQDGDGVVNHRLVVDRQQLFADSFGDRV